MTRSDAWPHTTRAYRHGDLGHGLRLPGPARLHNLRHAVQLARQLTDLLGAELALSLSLRDNSGGLLGLGDGAGVLRGQLERLMRHRGLLGDKLKQRLGGQGRFPM